MSDQVYFTGPALYNSTAITTGGFGYTFATPSGVEATLGQKQNVRKEISSALYMKFVKSKLGKVQQERVKKRLAKLQNLIAYSKEMGQRALYEALCEEIAVLVREAEAVAYGIDSWLEEESINKYRTMVKEKCIKWEPLEKFPRVVPKSVQAKVKQLEKAKVFDEFHILYIDYTGQKLETTKEKIRNKDPILFGRFSHQPTRYYYIADWVDEYCDLTLTKFVERFKQEDPGFGVEQVEEITQERLDGIVAEVKARHDRLANTKPSNWRDLEREEEIAARGGMVINNVPTQPILGRPATEADQPGSLPPTDPPCDPSLTAPMKASEPVTKRPWYKIW